MATGTTGITSACTCSVDGVSGDVDTRYKGYSFTGCAAHVGYMDGVLEGAGYETTRCYVTSPDDCFGEEPYVPEGFTDDSTLHEWKQAGAAWKECYDGYRCEAWWGSLDEQPQGDPVILSAPMDWPDCCALCSNIDGDGVATEICAGWSFHPGTGSCQLLATVSFDDSVSASWGVNATIHGYPGYFEPPATGCWDRAESGLCENMLFYLLVPWAGFAFAGFLYVWWAVVHIPSEKSRLLGELLRDRQSSRLEKATCVEVSVTRSRATKGKGESKWVETFEGTFMTHDNALFVVPQMTEGEVAPPLSRAIEQDVLRVLFAEGMELLADRDVAARCRTTQGLKKEFHRLLEKARWELKQPPTSATRRPQQNKNCSSFDCLLVVSGDSSAGQDQSERKALLVGALGERHITCVDDLALGFSNLRFSPLEREGIFWPIVVLSGAIATLVAFSVVLLSSEAAQAMAVWMFNGTDYRSVAAVCLALCVAVPVALLARRMHVKATIMRLIEQCPPAMDGQT